MVVGKLKRLAMDHPKLVVTAVLFLLTVVIAQDPVAADSSIIDTTGGAEVDNGP